MRIHTDTILSGDLYDAARIARVTIERAGLHNSKSRDHAWDIALSGESRRRPMGGSTEHFAATWDQWGVFLSVLFDRDANLTIPRVYDDFVMFDYKTKCRFVNRGVWPADAHGDHTFRFAGIPCQQTCTKCSATTQWKP